MYIFLILIERVWILFFIMKKFFLFTLNKFELELLSGVFRVDRIKRILVNLEIIEFF